MRRSPWRTTLATADSPGSVCHVSFVSLNLNFLLSLYSSVTHLQTHISYIPCTNHGYVWRYKERKGFRLLLPHLSSLCDVSVHWGYNCMRLSFCVSRATHLRRHIPRKDGCLPASRPGISLVTSIPYLLHTPGRRGSQLASRQWGKASSGKYTQNTQLRVSHNLLYDVIPSSKAITTNLYGGTNKQYGGVCLLLDVSRLLLYGTATCPLPWWRKNDI